MKNLIPTPKSLSRVIDTLRMLIHDIKNILCILEMSQTLVKQNLEEGNSAKALELVTKSLDQIQRMKNLASNSTEDKIAVGVCKVLQEMLMDLRVKKVTIGYDFQYGEKFVFMKPLELYRIIHNLLDNALDAVKEVEQGEIRFRVKSENGMVHVIVFNNGPKIQFKGEDSAKSAQYIFDTGYSTKEGRRGLGLAIVKELTHANDGKIRVANCRPVGVEFALMLPECEDATT